MDQWSFERLEDVAADEMFMINCPQKFSALMKLSDFLKYTFEHEDDRPLYLFDNHFHKKIPITYEIPSFLNVDHFSLIGILTYLKTTIYTIYTSKT